jgi:fatty acid elongase 3
MASSELSLSNSLWQASEWLNQGSVDWSKVEWKQLYSTGDFHWRVGVTPFSQLQIPIVISVIYLTTLFSLKSFMNDRKALSLKGFSFIHNIILTVWSLSMFLGASYGAILKYKASGFWAGLVCEQHPDPMEGPLFYWSYIFYLSKFYELVDSYLLVLKKKPLIFLHVFHHFIMPFVCWAGLEGKWTMALWTSCFWNSFVHVWMYYYYAVSTIGYNPWWKRYLTILQIYQFVSGVFYTAIYFHYYFVKVSWVTQGSSISISVEKGCTGDLGPILFMFSVNISFLVLFSKWYVDNYYETAARSRSRNTQEVQQPAINKQEDAIGDDVNPPPTILPSSPASTTAQTLTKRKPSK